MIPFFGHTWILRELWLIHQRRPKQLSALKAVTETTPTPWKPRRSGVYSVEQTKSEPPKLTVATALALQLLDIQSGK